MKNSNRPSTSLIFLPVHGRAASLHFKDTRMWQSYKMVAFGLLTCVAYMVPQLASSAVITSGCADVNVSCTLSELVAGGNFSVNNRLFSDWEQFEGPQASIVVRPFIDGVGVNSGFGFDVEFNPAFSVNEKGRLVSFITSYHISRDPDSIGSPVGAVPSVFSAAVQTGTIRGAGDFVETRLDEIIESGFGNLNLRVECIEVSSPCSNAGYGQLRDSVVDSIGDFPLQVSNNLSLFVQADTGGTPTAEVFRFRNAFGSLIVSIPEPNSVLLVACGLMTMFVSTKRGRSKQPR